MIKTNNKHRVFQLSIVCALTALVVMSSKSSNAAEVWETLHDSTLPVLSGAQRISHADANLNLHVAVTLTIPDQQAADDFITTLYDPQSPNYHKFLTPAEFATRFGPSTADYNAVKSHLIANGLTISGEYPNHLVIDATGPLTNVEQAFGVQINNYSANGRNFIANDGDVQLPQSISHAVTAVTGLENYLQLQPHHHSPTSLAVSGKPVGFTPQQIATAYNFTTAYTNKFTGTGKTIAIATAYGVSTTDISNFFKQFSITAPTYSQVQVGGPSGYINVESTLDLQRVGAMAYGANIIEYEGANPQFTTFQDVYQTILNNTKVSVVTTSWGICEAEMPASNLNADHTIFTNAAADGQAWFAASGDSGSNDCGTRNGTGVDYPSSDPNVTATGGTTLILNTNNSISSETAWSGSGGGVSIDFAIPAYQTAAGLSNTKNARQTADVALDANPNTGYPVLFNNSWSEWGGTSFAAPQWAAIWAIAEQAKGKLGAANLNIYPLKGGTSFRDITSGSNGAYSAKTGWDYPTGWGTPNVGNLLNKLP